MIVKDSVMCSSCKQENADYALDCLCLLCTPCFKALGRQRISKQALSFTDEESTCLVCDRLSRGETKSLKSLSEGEKVEFVCNLKLVNGYLEFKHLLLMETAKEINELNNEMMMMEKRLGQEQQSLRYAVKLLGYLKEKYNVTLEDIDPTFYFNDRTMILSRLFMNESKEEVTPVKQTDRAALTGSDTKKKSVNLIDDKENYINNNPFNIKRSSFSSRLTKEGHRESSKSVPSQKDSNRKCVNEDTPMVKSIVGDRVGLKNDHSPFSFALKNQMENSKGMNPMLFRKRSDQLLMEAPKIRNNIFINEKVVGRCLETEFHSISEIKDKSDKDCLKSLESFDNNAIFIIKEETENKSPFFIKQNK